MIATLAQRNKAAATAKAGEGEHHGCQRFESGAVSLPERLTLQEAVRCWSGSNGSWTKQPGPMVALDASGLKVFDSSAVAVLLALRRNLLAQGKTLSVDHWPQRLRGSGRAVRRERACCWPDCPGCLTVCARPYAQPLKMPGSSPVLADVLLGAGLVSCCISCPPSHFKTSPKPTPRPEANSMP